MKTCLRFFADLKNDNCDYVQEIYEAEQELEGLRDRLRIQNLADFVSLEEDIIRFKKFMNTNSTFLRIYNTVFQKISDRHAEAVYFDQEV